MGTRRGAGAATTPTVPVVREVQLALVTSLTQAVVAELLRELRRVHQALVSPSHPPTALWSSVSPQSTPSPSKVLQFPEVSNTHWVLQHPLETSNPLRLSKTFWVFQHPSRSSYILWCAPISQSPLASSQSSSNFWVLRHH